MNVQTETRLFTDPTDYTPKVSPFANYRRNVEQEAEQDAWIYLVNWIEKRGKYIDALVAWIDAISHRTAGEDAISANPKAPTGGRMTRHMGTTKDVTPAQLEPPVLVDHIVSVGWHWIRGKGGHDGYDLYLAAGGYPHVFPEHEWRIVEALPSKLDERKEARVKVNWRVEWSKPQGIISISSWEGENVKSIGDAIKPIEDRISEQHDAHVANRPATDFDTFDQPDAKKTPNELTAKIKTYMAIVGKWADLYGVPAKGRDEFYHTLLDVKSFYDWTGGFEEAKAQTHRGIMDAYPNDAALRVEIKDLLDTSKLPLDTFKDAVGHLSIEAAREAGMKPSQIWDKVGWCVLALRNKAEEASETQTVKGNTNMPQQTKTERSSASETGNLEPVDIKDKIREKYNQPQRGKDYLTVPGRVLLFRVDHPDWTIDTDVIAVTDTAAVFKATIKNADGRTIATGHGRATEAGTKNLGGRFIEKAETAAIGRALALAGFGTDDTLDDADYLSDSPIEKRSA